MTATKLAPSHLCPESQGLSAGGDLREIADAMSDDWTALRQAAEMYYDHQKFRIGTNNRLGSGTVAYLTAGYEIYAEALERLEDDLSKDLVRMYRQAVPAGVIAWANESPGIGDHLLARLLGHLGHPRLAVPMYWTRNSDVADDEFGDADNPKRILVVGEPHLRSFSQLRQYCGHGAANRRRAGMTQEEAFALGNPRCKMLIHLLAVAVLKAQVRNNPTKHAIGPYGEVYLATRTEYSQKAHSVDCPGGLTNAGGRVVKKYCKHDGHRAVAGDPFEASHLHSIALRHVGKRILSDLYDAAWEEWCS